MRGSSSQRSQRVSDEGDVMKAEGSVYEKLVRKDKCAERSKLKAKKGLLD